MYYRNTLIVLTFIGYFSSISLGISYNAMTIPFHRPTKRKVGNGESNKERYRRRLSKRINTMMPKNCIETRENVCRRFCFRGYCRKLCYPKIFVNCYLLSG